MLTVRGGYHGDTFGAMAVCDPVTGMHHLFAPVLPTHHFADRPALRFDDQWYEDAISNIADLFERHHDAAAAFIVEPIVQGAGGMWFYHPHYLHEIRALCDRYEVLLICDEIATGFGRSGRFLASEYAGITPDILCLGKALTGGYLSLAATMTTREVADTIGAGDPGVFMHGPTFMANALACAAANASLELLAASDSLANIMRIETRLRDGLEPCRELAAVTDVRTLGAIGVVEMAAQVDMRTAPPRFVERGVWVRPFGRLVYVMPPYIIEDDDIDKLTAAIYAVASELGV